MQHTIQIREAVHFNLTHSQPPTKVQLARRSMKPGLNIGQIGDLTGIVDPKRPITLRALAEATVLSTPAMVMLMERAAHEARFRFFGAEGHGCKRGCGN
jgi:hypothetical protein